MICGHKEITHIEILSSYVLEWIGFRPVQTKKVSIFPVNVYMLFLEMFHLGHVYVKKVFSTICCHPKVCFSNLLPLSHL